MLRIFTRKHYTRCLSLTWFAHLSLQVQREWGWLVVILRFCSYLLAIKEITAIYARGYGDTCLCRGLMGSMPFDLFRLCFVVHSCVSVLRGGIKQGQVIVIGCIFPRIRKRTRCYTCTEVLLFSLS